MIRGGGGRDSASFGCCVAASIVGISAANVSVVSGG